MKQMNICSMLNKRKTKDRKKLALSKRKEEIIDRKANKGNETITLPLRSTLSRVSLCVLCLQMTKVKSFQAIEKLALASLGLNREGTINNGRIEQN